MNRNIAILLIFVLFSSACGHATGRNFRTKYFFERNQQEINEFTRSFLSGKRCIESDWIFDMREVHIDFKIEGEESTEKSLYYSANTVSSYFLCLLSTRSEIWKEEILNGDARKRLDSPEADYSNPCWSHLGKFDSTTHAAYVEYWRKYYETERGLDRNVGQRLFCD